MLEGTGWDTQWGRLNFPRSLHDLSQVNTLDFWSCENPGRWGIEAHGGKVFHPHSHSKLVTGNIT